MTEQVIVMNGERGLGPFKSAVAASLYLSKLGINEFEPVSVVAPPPMSALLMKAFAFLKDNRNGVADGFFDAIDGTPEEGVSEAQVEEVLSQARALLDVLSPDRTKMGNVELAKLLFEEHRASGGNAITAIQALRSERPDLGLIEARETMRKTGLYH